jgi:hypothetical protein
VPGDALENQWLPAARWPILGDMFRHAVALKPAAAGSLAAALKLAGGKRG